MKKFNVDEFIWFLILVLLTVFLAYLIISGDINYLLSANVTKWIYVAVMLLIAISIIQFKRVFSFNSRKDNTYKYLPITLTLIIGILLSYNTFQKVKLDNNGNIDDISSDLGNTIKISNENYNILQDINRNPEDYFNKNINFVGFIHEVDKLEENKFFLAREEIQCCAADAIVVGLKIKCNEKLEKGTWINAVGEVKYDGDYYLEIIDYKEVLKPKEPYFKKSKE